MTRLKSRQISAEYESMNDSKTEWKFIVTTAFLVATIAIPTLASLVVPDEDLQRMPKTPYSNEQKARLPSSLPEPGSPKLEALVPDAKKELSNNSNSLISYDFSCAKIKMSDFKVKGAFLQLRGRDCAKSSQSPKLNITNKTNGFTASVFLLNTKEYQTDLIQLKEGENQISIEYQTPSGQVEEHVLNVKSDAI